MAGVLDSYGYWDDGTQLVTLQTQEEWKQSAKDQEQDSKIQQNYNDNVYQQGEIDRNTLINDIQEAQINEINEIISQITGGTTVDFDMGNW